MSAAFVVKGSDFMENTPLAFRTHVSIFGSTNAGKSALFNKLIGQDMMIVSDTAGTTTDPVTKAMELLPYGPIALTDTAGLGDMSIIGEERMKKTKKILEKTDFAIYVSDINNFDVSAYHEILTDFNKMHIKHLLVFTKCENNNNNKEYPDAVYVSIYDDGSIEKLKKRLQEELSKVKTNDSTMIGGLLPEGSTIVMVVPIDSEAPKGRLILPQVQFLRDCLDHHMKTIVVRESELKAVLADLGNVDLVVTDSQVFGTVASIVPEDIMLTSFSMMMARMKGDLSKLIEGAEAIKMLTDTSRILIAEACTHNVSHEDIGRVKIPKLLRKSTGKKLEFDHYFSHDFPSDLSKYDLVIHCGGCMINSRSMNNRIEFCRQAGVPITNYGVVLAYANGILERSTQIFRK